MAVRRTLLTDVPASPSQFVQQCGRAIRMYGHRGLPAEEQNVVTQLYVATFPKWMSSPLACWALSAQSTSGSGRELEKRARFFLGRLKRAGIDSLASLKSQIDKHVARGSCGPLTAEGVAAFLQSKGLWEEVRLMKRVEQKDPDKRAHSSKRNPLLQALQTLHSAKSNGDESLLMCPETADEAAVQHLARQTQNVAPALAELRATAVDHQIFAHLAEGTTNDHVASSCHREAPRSGKRGMKELKQASASVQHDHRPSRQIAQTSRIVMGSRNVGGDVRSCVVDFASNPKSGSSTASTFSLGSSLRMRLDQRQQTRTPQRGQRSCPGVRRSISKLAPMAKLVRLRSKTPSSGYHPSGTILTVTCRGHVKRLRLRGKTKCNADLRAARKTPVRKPTRKLFCVAHGRHELRS